ncbi:hypothetical protein ES703_98277 [subsurface metagenome]
MKTTTPRKLLDSNFFYILWYGKQIEQVKYRQLFVGKPCDEWARETPGGSWGAEIDAHRRPLTPEEKANTNLLGPGAKVYQLSGLTSAGAAKDEEPFSYEEETFYPEANQHWKTTSKGMTRLIAANRIERRGGKPWFTKFHADFPYKRLTNIFTDTSGKSTEMIYVVQTQPVVIARCLLMSTDPGDLVLDPTCGSGTTAFVAEQWGRRWITIDTGRVALTLARTRLMSARFPYYLLADSPEGIKKEAELTGGTPPDYKTEGDIKKGFVYKRVPHITLKSIANIPDIKEGMTREEIDKAIARYADIENMYDQSYEDSRRIRVTGPFTAESLSPHRVFATDEERPTAEIEAQKEAGVGQFETMILDNLKKAGVQNTIKNERLKFDRLEPYAGEWLHAEGEYTEKDGTTRRVAICIRRTGGSIASGPSISTNFGCITLYAASKSSFVSHV